MSSYCELQKQQRTQAKPGNGFSTHSTHNTMITQTLVEFHRHEPYDRRTVARFVSGEDGIGGVRNALIDCRNTLNAEPRNKLAMMPTTMSGQRNVASSEEWKTLAWFARSRR
jgi:hypothetical protein